MVRELRDRCGECRYRRICAFGPAKYQIEVHSRPDARHRHAETLKEGLRRLSRAGEDWEESLLWLLGGREKDALLSACLLAVAWRRRPEKVLALADYAAERCDVDRLKAELTELSSEDETGLAPGQGIDPDALQCRMFRGQVIRLASFFPREEVLRAMQELLVLGADDEGRLFQYEAVGVLALLIGLRLPGDRWVRSLEKDIAGPFRATFAHRDPGNGSLDLFFPYRRGKKRSYLYYRRDPEGRERISSIDKIRIDSLLYRIFLVFKDDKMKVHRIFKELARHINVRAGDYNVDHVLAGFDRLSAEDLLLLGIYAPALARAVGHYLEIPDYHRLVKFLYSLRTESGRRGAQPIPAHEKVVGAHAEWLDLVDAIGEDVIKRVFAALFALNASYRRRVYTTPTYLKIGEVAYLLTALAGWNPKGLELELKQGRKALAFVAYGLQPPGKWSRLRVRRLRRAYERALDRGDEQIERAIEQGMRYMAALHGFDDFAELEAEAADEEWVPETAEPRALDRAEASAEDFSEYEDSGDSFVVDAMDEAEELFVVVEDGQASRSGRLKTQRMPRAQDEDELYLEESDPGD
ncbi:MAG: hypothetical protein D6731_19575 [Planctomycetota bacterium]|nr:MAG: hypothetical protein D6731_19575 [Planctomycetota bacterium]